MTASQGSGAITGTGFGQSNLGWHPKSSGRKRSESVVAVQLRVIFALMLHDIKSRFFGNGLGYVATILWPCVHIAVIVGIFYFIGRPAPYGDSRLLYASIGALPYIIWSYMSRFTIWGVIQNKSFLSYPIVKPLDLIVGRQCLEIVTSTIVTVGLFVFLLCCGENPLPHRFDEAALALFSAALLGIGFGVLGSVITMIFPLFSVIYILVLIVFWVSCGLAIDPEVLPWELGNLLAWNPLLHSLEWMRYAYYDDFPARLLDRTYVLGVGMGALAIGLIMERALRVFLTK